MCYVQEKGYKPAEYKQFDGLNARDCGVLGKPAARALYDFLLRHTVASLMCTMTPLCVPTMVFLSARVKTSGRYESSLENAKYVPMPCAWIRDPLSLAKWQKQITETAGPRGTDVAALRRMVYEDPALHDMWAYEENVMM